MMTIDSYSFGRIVINGREYNSDVIIYPDHVNSSWWRKVGHSLCADDIQDIIKAEPEILIIGTGSAGAMTVPPDTERYIKSKGIRVVIQPTKSACDTYNKLCTTHRVIAALHLTC
jgi:hypothetical protein